MFEDQYVELLPARLTMQTVIGSGGTGGSGGIGGDALAVANSGIVIVLNNSTIDTLTIVNMGTGAVTADSTGGAGGAAGDGGTGNIGDQSALATAPDHVATDQAALAPVTDHASAPDPAAATQAATPDQAIAPGQTATPDQATLAPAGTDQATPDQAAPAPVATGQAALITQQAGHGWHDWGRGRW